MRVLPASLLLLLLALAPAAAADPLDPAEELQQDCELVVVTLHAPFVTIDPDCLPPLVHCPVVEVLLYWPWVVLHPECLP